MEAVTDLDRLIERRSRQSGEQRPEEVMYAESVRRYNARRRKEIRAQWYCYFSRLADSLRSRAAEYDARAEALMEEEGR
jgi:hypothetical protein